jgi:hypothetical protein
MKRPYIYPNHSRHGALYVIQDTSLGMNTIDSIRYVGRDLLPRVNNHPAQVSVALQMVRERFVKHITQDRDEYPWYFDCTNNGLPDKATDDGVLFEWAKTNHRKFPKFIAYGPLRGSWSFEVVANLINVGGFHYRVLLLADLGLTTTLEDEDADVASFNELLERFFIRFFLCLGAPLMNKSDWRPIDETYKAYKRRHPAKFAAFNGLFNGWQPRKQDGAYSQYQYWVPSVRPTRGGRENEPLPQFPHSFGDLCERTKRMNPYTGAIDIAAVQTWLADVGNPDNAACPICQRDRTIIQNIITDVLNNANPNW